MCCKADDVSLSEAYLFHVSDDKLNHDHFFYRGVRYVKCEKCGNITPVNNCMYYGGEGDRMFIGGCRECFSERG